MRGSARTLDASVISCNKAISALKHAQPMPQRPSALASLLRSMAKEHIEASTVTFNAAATVMASCWLWEHAANVVEDLKTKSLEPDIFSCGIAAQSVGQTSKADPDASSADVHQAQRHNDWAVSMQFLEELRQDHIQVGTRLLSSNTKAAAQQAWRRAADTLATLDICALRPDTTSVNIVLHGLGVHRQWEAVSRLLSSSLHATDYFRSVSLRPDAVSISAACKAWTDAGHWKLAVARLGLLDAAASAGPGEAVDAVLFAVSLDASVEGSHWMAAASQLARSAAPQHRDNVVAMNIVLKAYKSESMWTAACDALVAGRRSLSCAVPNDASYNTALGACEAAAQWDQALCCLDAMQHAGVQPSGLSWNAAVRAAVAGTATDWMLALAIMQGCPLRDAISYRVVVAALCNDEPNGVMLPPAVKQLQEREKRTNFEASSWRAAAELTRELSLQFSRTERPTTCMMANLAWCLSACRSRDAGVYQDLARQAFHSMGTFSSQDLASLSAAYAKAAMRNLQLERGIAAAAARRLKLFKCRELATLAWALATVGGQEAEQLELAARLSEEAEAILQSSSGDHFDAQELSNLAWAMVSLTVASPALMYGIAARAAPVIDQFRPAEASMLIWTFATRRLVDEALVGRIIRSFKWQLHEERLQDVSSERLPELAAAVTRLSWSLHHMGRIPDGLLEPFRNGLQCIGGRLDDGVERRESPRAARGAKSLPAGGNRYEECQGDANQPRILHKQHDVVVLQKPPGWQVYADPRELQAEDGELPQLSAFLGKVLRERSAILEDIGHQHGFLHRLDVPSSGLILCATSYSAYFDLQLQLSTGGMCREYVVLLHGLLPPGPSAEVDVPLYWSGVSADPSIAASPRGKPSLTRFVKWAYADGPSGALTLAIVRIFTGRRHQIRAHCAHLGHPTVCDGKYTCKSTWRADSSWVPRNFLHRFRLGFRHQNGQAHDIVEPLPNDLAAALEAKVKPIGAEARSFVKTWLSEAL
eukprot:TRINITY_DN31602_c0_g1_i1.p1 TRINITY_DN31602_c0_g1~~TRINITY_DN31602_c0_g1_i1.p1  ORF type:complete len:992 (-),score=166.77 TRINITY_DN31602_c0_g1_i1:612-3587(-)